MNGMSDYYLRLGHDPERLETSPEYLSWLALDAAIDIDNYSSGRSEDLSHVREFAGILEKYQTKDTDTTLNWGTFPYMPLWKAIYNKTAKKDRHHVSDLALEMRLLRAELESVAENPQKSQEMMDFLLDCCREFSYERQSYRHYLAA